MQIRKKGKKEDVLHVVQQIFNNLTNKTIVSFEWPMENVCSVL